VATFCAQPSAAAKTKAKTIFSDIFQVLTKSYQAKRK
jgi:hypothetical protein